MRTSTLALCLVVLFAVVANAALDERTSHQVHSKRKAQAKNWFKLEDLLRDQVLDQTQTSRIENHREQTDESSGGSEADPERSYVKQKSGGTTTVIANRNFMSIMEEPDAKPLTPEKAAEEARLEAQEQELKKVGEGQQKRNNDAYRSKIKNDEAREKQARKDKDVAEGKKRAEEEVQKAQEGAQKTNERTLEATKKREEQHKAAEKAKSDKCRKIKVNPSQQPAQFSTPVFNYPYGWNFQGGWSFNSRAGLVADFNGDGKADFARLGGQYIHFFISKGDGQYYYPIYRYPAGWDFTHDENIWTSLKATDINGDGKMDIIRTYGTYNHAMITAGSDADCWNKNDWIPSFCMTITAYQYPSGWNFRGDWHWNHPFTIQGDFNGDGKGDYGRLGAGYMHLFISKGNGQFYSPIYRYPDGWSFSLDPNQWTPAAIDVSGDCRTDIVFNAGTLSRSFIVQGNDNQCWFKDGWIDASCFKTTEFKFPGGWNFVGGWTWNSRAFIKADFNADGKQDFARLGAKYIHFFISKGNGQYFVPVYYFPNGWDFTFDENVWTSLPSGDFDGDGKFDIIRTSGRYNHGLLIRGSNQDCWLRDGDIPAACIGITSFTYPNGWNFVGYWSWNTDAVRVADFNGDNRDDFIQLCHGVYNHQFFAL